MGPIEYALSGLANEISDEVLQAAFQKGGLSVTRKWGIDQNQSIDALVRYHVIDKRVNRDCSLYASKVIYVPLAHCEMERVDRQTTLYRIPLHETDNLRIIETEHVSYYSSDHRRGMMHDSRGGNDLASAALDMHHATANFPVVSTAKVEIVGPNIVQVKDTMHSRHPYKTLICHVENTKLLDKLSRKAYMNYAELVHLATKAYVYRQLRQKLGRGKLQNGAEWGEFRSEVEEFSDANERYKDFLREKWPKMAFFTDDEAVDRMVGHMVGRGF